jgi:hypothetical protein
MASGLVQIADGQQPTPELISSTISNGMNVSIIILAMSFGLIIPKLMIDHLSDRSARAKS